MKITKFIIPFLLFSLAFISYLNIFKNELFYDDEELIYKNYYVQNLSRIPEYFTQNMVAGAGKVSNMYRPVLLLSFAIDYHFWKSNPAGFHLTSIFLHGANGILLFYLILRMFKEKTVALVLSVIFIVHPVQTEAIAYASGRCDPLFSFFCFSTLLLFLSNIKKNGLNVFTYILAVICYILAILSKESAVITPLLILLVYCCQNGEKIKYKKFIFMIMPFLVVTVLYIMLRIFFLNFSNIFNFYDKSNIYSQNIFVRLYTFFYVFFQYIYILIFPKDLVFSRSVNYITSIYNFWVMLFSAFLIFSVFIIKKTWRKNKIFTFAIFWFFISLLPSTGIIPINSIIAEHYLYLPSVAFFLILAYAFFHLWNKNTIKSNRIILLNIISFGVLLLTVRTLIRNFDWANPIVFYTKSLSQSPWNIPMRNNLAMSYADRGQLDLAISEYKFLIENADVYPNTHHNLANIYSSMKLYHNAEEEYKKALKIDPHFMFSYYGLLDLYKITGEKDKYDKLIQEKNSYIHN